MKMGFVVEFNGWSRNESNTLHPKHPLALLTLCAQRKGFPSVILKPSAIQRGLFAVCKAGRVHELIIKLSVWTPRPCIPSALGGQKVPGEILETQGQLHPSSQGCSGVYNQLSHFYLGVWAFGNGVHSGVWLSLREKSSRLRDLGENFGNSNW